jgi:membrane fusion protein, heavy metal efflux system
VRQLRPYGADVVLPTGASVIVSSPVTGTLQLPKGRTFPQVGQRVKANEPLLELLPLLSPERAVLTPAERVRFAEARNAVAQTQIDAEGQLQQAEVRVEAAQIALDRAQRLLREQAGTVRAVDEAQAQLKLAQKGLQAAKTRKQLVDNINLDEESGTLTPLTITSPMTGEVRGTQVRPGEIVAPAAVLFEIMDDSVVWVKVPVYVGDLPEIDMKQPARLAAPDGRPTGIEVIAPPVDLPPTATPLAAAVDLYFKLENDERRFSPGQRLTAHLVLTGTGEHNVMPWSAVIHDIHGGQWVYEVVAEGKYARRRVEVAWVDGPRAVLARGPKPGTIVVTAGAAELAGTEFGFAK